MRFESTADYANFVYTITYTTPACNPPLITVLTGNDVDTFRYTDNAATETWTLTPIAIDPIECRAHMGYVFSSDDGYLNAYIGTTALSTDMANP